MNGLNDTELDKTHVPTFVAKNLAFFSSLSFFLSRRTPNFEEPFSRLSDFYYVKRDIINLTEIISPITNCHYNLSGCTFHLGRTRGGHKHGSGVSCCVLCYQIEKRRFNQNNWRREISYWVWAVFSILILYLWHLKTAIIDSFKMFSKYRCEQVIIMGSSARCYVGNLKPPICVGNSIKQRTQSC